MSDSHVEFSDDDAGVFAAERADTALRSQAEMFLAKIWELLHADGDIIDGRVGVYDMEDAITRVILRDGWPTYDDNGGLDA